MSARDVARVLAVPGRFYVAPTGFSAAPYGGTALGYVGDVSVENSVFYEGIVAEEFGEEFGEIIEVQGTAVLGCTMRQYDPDLYQRIFPSTAAESIGDGERRVSFPGSVRSGRLRGSTGIVLLFAPEDPRNPGLLCYRAVPCVDAARRLTFDLGTDLEVAVLFYLMRGSAGQAYTIERVSNMTLSP